MQLKTQKNTSTLTPQIHHFDFYKDSTGWYIDFPEFITSGYGTKADLAMVSGADTMLDYLSKGNTRIKLSFSNYELSEAKIELKMVTKNQWGATYKTNHLDIPQVWLCNVTKLFFNGAHPHRIFIR
jgi:hypothetical protein